MKTINYVQAILLCSAISVTAQTQSNSASATSPGQLPPSIDPTKQLIRMSREERERADRINRRVILNVVVTDSSGRPVKGLGEQDFTLIDSQQQRPIISFQPVDGHSAAARAHVILLIDSLNNPFLDVARQRREAERYLGQNGGNLAYPVSLVLLTNSGSHEIDQSQDGHALINKLRESSSETHRFGFNGGPDGENHRLISSIRALTKLADREKDTPGRAILIWLGQGWPILTDPGFVAATPDDKKSYFDALVQLSTVLREAQITVDNVASHGSSHVADPSDRYYKGFLSGVRSSIETDTQNLALPVLAYQSGGRVLNGEAQIADEIARCVADADMYYRLSFDPDAASRPNELRDLQVKVDKPELLPRTNTLYYAQP